MERTNQKRRRGFRPTPAFWIKVALAATLISPLLPHWLLLVLGILVLALPAWLFRP